MEAEKTSEEQNTNKSTKEDLKGLPLEKTELEKSGQTDVQTESRISVLEVAEDLVSRVSIESSLEGLYHVCSPFQGTTPSASAATKSSNGVVHQGSVYCLYGPSLQLTYFFASQFYFHRSAADRLTRKGEFISHLH